MKFFTFKAYGSTLTITAEGIAQVRDDEADKLFGEGATDLSEAYGIANKELLWSNPESKDGMWKESAEKNTYHWVEDNFFN